MLLEVLVTIVSIPVLIAVGWLTDRLLSGHAAGWARSTASGSPHSPGPQGDIPVREGQNHDQVVAQLADEVTRAPSRRRKNRQLSPSPAPAVKPVAHRQPPRVRWGR